MIIAHVLQRDAVHIHEIADGGDRGLYPAGVGYFERGCPSAVILGHQRKGVLTAPDVHDFDVGEGFHARPRLRETTRSAFRRAMPSNFPGPAYFGRDRSHAATSSASQARLRAP